MMVWMEMDFSYSVVICDTCAIFVLFYFILHGPTSLKFKFFIVFNKGCTVNSLLTDNPVNGQLYLRTPFQIPVLSPSQTLYLHIPVSGHSLVSGRGHF